MRRYPLSRCPDGAPTQPPLPALHASRPTRRGAGRWPRQRAFTLLELLITLTIAAIVLSLGVPGFRDLVQNNRVAAQTNELVTALNLARTEAVKRGRDVQVVVAGQAAGWSANVALADEPDDPLRVVDRAGGSITIDPGSETVTFLPTGVPSAAVPVFVMEPLACNGMQRRQITVAPSGQITTARQACD